MNTISWVGETSPLPMESTARRLRADVRTRRRRRRRLRRMQENRSILDSIAEKRRLQKRVGAQDRARLDDYLDDVREIERRIQLTERETRKRHGGGGPGRDSGSVRRPCGADVRPAGGCPRRT